tara:strand:+ start:1100 stop:1384 length:285 start_codon:yes stop_codon:yes gene_type:complete
MKKIIDGVEIDLTEEELNPTDEQLAAEKIEQDSALSNEHRSTRNTLLAASDWTQANDSPLTAEKKVEWATYRTALRNLPTSEGWPSVTFPTEPS